MKSARFLTADEAGWLASVSSLACLNQKSGAVIFHFYVFCHSSYFLLYQFLLQLQLTEGTLRFCTCMAE